MSDVIFAFFFFNLITVILLEWETYDESKIRVQSQETTRKPW